MGGLEPRSPYAYEFHDARESSAVDGDRLHLHHLQRRPSDTGLGPGEARKTLPAQRLLDDESFPNAESAIAAGDSARGTRDLTSRRRVGRGGPGPAGRRRLALVTAKIAFATAALVLALFLPAAYAGAEDSSDPLEDMGSACLAKCIKEKEGDSRCSRYCTCHLDAIRRGLSNAEIRRMLELAASKKPGAERIRLWLFGAAGECHTKIFGEEPDSLKR